MAAPDPMRGDQLRAQYPEVFRAVRAPAIMVESHLIRLLVHWLGDYIKLKQQPGQPGVPEGVIAAQMALAEAHAAVSDSRQHERDELTASGIVISGHDDVCVGTPEAAAALGISADTVRWHCRKGNLDGRKIGRQLMVTTASIEDFKYRRKAERSA